MNNKKQNDDEITIDLVQLFKALWKKLWSIILVGILCGVIAFGFTHYMIPPKYSSSIMLYVNNSSINLSNTSVKISSSDISAAQDLVKTYIVLLKNRTTLESVIAEAKLDYNYKELNQMITAAPVDSTEVFEVKVTSTDPYEAEKIANTIADVLPQRTGEIIEGTSMAVVDSGVANLQKVAPNTTKNTLLGFIAGAFIVAVIVIIKVLMDDTIYDMDYMMETYDYPILAKVPDLLDNSDNKYGYYKKSKKSKKA